MLQIVHQFPALIEQVDGEFDILGLFNPDQMFIFIVVVLSFLSDGEDMDLPALKLLPLLFDIVE